MEIDGRTAVVTGGGAGLGEVLVQWLAGAGAQVVVADVDADAAHATVRALREAGHEAMAWVGDVAEEGPVCALMDLVSEWGGPEIVVNNAGGWTDGHQFPAAPRDRWARTLALNLVTPMRTTQLAAERLRGRPGAVVNIASSAGLGGDGYGSPEYAAAKAGLIRFTTACAGLEASQGLRVMCVVPGWIGLPRAHRELAAMSAEQRAAAPPLVRPERVAQVVVDLVRDGTTGAVIELLEGAG